MDRFARLTGRHYSLFEYIGTEQPECLIALMGSGIGAAQETVEHLVAEGEKLGMLKVRLFRPFSADRLLNAIPDSVQKIAVLDRTKEPGADGEPLYKDVLGAFAQAYSDGRRNRLPRITCGRYGLSSKEFTPAMVKGIFGELSKEKPRNPFTVGIIDDLSKTSLSWDSRFRPAASRGVTACIFYGLGADGTVSANKNSIKIIGEETENHAQGYFQYDSKKSGAVTVSHLRFGPDPINSTYLIDADEASFVACHQPIFLDRYQMIDKAKPGGVFLLNTSVEPEQVWDSLLGEMQQQMIAKALSFYIIDAYKIAADTGMGRRINTIMQTCFFAISGLLDQSRAIALIKEAVKKSYGRKGARLLDRNYAAIDATLAGLHQVPLSRTVTQQAPHNPVVPASVPAFVQQVTSLIIAGKGDYIPVSLMPADGTCPWAPPPMKNAISPCSCRNGR